MNPATPAPSEKGLQSQPLQASSQQTVLRVFEGEFLIDDGHSRREQAADNTCRPIFNPIDHCGQDFKPFHIEHRDASISPLPLSPLALFQLFIPESLVNKWVKYTNEAPAPGGPPSPSKTRSRKHTWKPVTADEIYLWLAILIYLGIHREKKVSSHWVVQKRAQQCPTHPIIKFITFDRFQQLLRRVRIHPHTQTSRNPFSRCNEWSNHLQITSMELYQPGTSIAVDEAMIGFTGRSKQTTHVPNKPTPRGFKAWVVAQRGFFLRWIWHDPKAPLGPVGGRQQRKRKRATEAQTDDAVYLNPTQSVVVALIDLLPKQTYHVFLDNLFSSPNLFEALRKQGAAATGTCRVNCGLYKPFIEAKARDTRGICWKWGTLEAVPTPSGLVSYPRTQSL